MSIINYNWNSESYVKSGSERVITCTSNSIVGNFKYRFYLEIIYDGQTYSYTFRPNASGYGLININKILQSIVQPISVQQVLTVPDADTSLLVNDFQQNIHSMPHFKFAGTGHNPQYISTGGTTVKRVLVKLWDFYANNATDVPTKQNAPQQNYYYVFSGQGKSTDLINELYTNFKLTGNSSEFISPLYTEKVGNGNIYSTDVDLTDYGTISIFNRTQVVNGSADPYRLFITYYDADDNILAQQGLLNSATYGGEYNSGAGVTNDSMILTFGCFPANLNKLPATFNRPSDYSALAYYYVGFLNSTNQSRSAYYKFNVVDRCKKYDTQRFAYINSMGVWEYITFNKKRTDKLSNKKTEIKSSVFDYSRAYTTITPDEYKEGSYVPGVAHESRVVKSSNIKSSFTINTGFLKPHEILKVKEMFLAPKISYINTDGTAIAVILTNPNIDDVVVSHRYEQTEYKLNFEYSVPKHNPIIF